MNDSSELNVIIDRISREHYKTLQRRFQDDLETSRDREIKLEMEVKKYKQISIKAQAYFKSKYRELDKVVDYKDKISDLEYQVKKERKRYFNKESDYDKLNKKYKKLQVKVGVSSNSNTPFIKKLKTRSNKPNKREILDRIRHNLKYNSDNLDGIIGNDWNNFPCKSDSCDDSDSDDN
jgi:hypothetical protein